MKKFATDVGGVLREHKRNPCDKEIRWVEKSKWALKKLLHMQHMGHIQEVHIISHVRPENTENLRNILRNSFVKDYIPEERWHFVHQRQDKIKVMKEYSIDTLVDDRPDIIQWVKEAGLCGILFRSKDFPDWKSVIRYVRFSESGAI